jgi:hypothetical protein
MPVRELIYFTYILERMIKNRNIYGKSLVRIPIPRFAVFYNGEANQPAQYDMRLSDAFEHPVENPEIELICKVYNINFGHNDELLDRCPVLKEYMTFVDYVRANHKENDYDNLQDAIERAIDRCMEENILREFFMKHRSEVVKVMQLDYTFDRQILLEREEARMGRAEEIIEMGQEFGLTDAAILERLQKKLDVSLEVAAGYLKQYGKTLV